MELHDLSELFECVAVINLSRRGDRWRRFLRHLPPDWPFGPPLRFPAVDGSEVTVPEWWTEGAGAWGCYLSHLAVIEVALERGIQRLLILEDDAVVTSRFAIDVRLFLAHVPADWKIIYFGGQHIELDKQVPIRINEWAYRPYNVNRSHAYALRGLATLRHIHEHIVNPEAWRSRHHIDHRLGEYQKMHPEGLYAPGKWLVGQYEGDSDVSGEKVGLRMFRNAADIVALARSGPLRQSQ